MTDVVADVPKLEKEVKQVPTGKTLMLLEVFLNLMHPNQ